VEKFTASRERNGKHITRLNLGGQSVNRFQFLFGKVNIPKKLKKLRKNIICGVLQQEFATQTKVFLRLLQE